MKVLLVNGSPHSQGCTATALEEVAKELTRQGIESEHYWIGTNPISGCIACGGCRRTDGCVLQDGVTEIGKRLDEFDAFVFGAPTYYGGPCGQLQCFMDRLFCSSSRKLMGKPAAAVVSCRRGGATAAFQRLNMYFQMTNMPVITSQYWNQVHGDNAQQVAQDLEGLQTMRTLAVNMAYVLKTAQAAGDTVPLPVRETVIRTNFIR